MISIDNSLPASPRPTINRHLHPVRVVVMNVGRENKRVRAKASIPETFPPTCKEILI
jgi:hypothetical protein